VPKILKRVLKTLLIAITVLIGLFLLLVLRLSSVRWAAISRQKTHLESLQEMYDTDYVPVNEQAFANFELDDPQLRLNEIRMIASHNSYKTMGTTIGKLFIGLGDSFAEAEALKYDNPPLSDQLDQGIRSFELDVRYRKETFEATHVPLVDNGSTAANLSLAFEEVALWSEHNPGHIPIILLLEFKSDWMILDPALKPIGTTELQLFDDLLIEKFGSTLYTPGMLKGDYSSPNARLQDVSWPLLQELRGKVIVIMHPGDLIEPYLALDPEYDDMVMFPAASDLDIDHDYATFVVHNDPDIDSIKTLLDNELIVRTRMDANLIRDDEIIQAAMDSGAQIMTTDFHPAHLFEDMDKQFLTEGYTVIINTVMLPDE